MSFLGFRLLCDKKYDALKEKADKYEIVNKNNYDLKKSIEEKDVEIEQKILMISKKDKENSELQSKISSLLLEISEKDKIISKSNSDIEKMKEEIVALGEDLSKSKDDNASLKGNSKKMLSTLKDYSLKIKNLERDLDEIRKLNEDYLENVTLLEKSKEVLDSEIIELKKMIDDCTIKNNNLLVENGELSNEITKLLNKIRSFSDNFEYSKEDAQLVPGTTEDPIVAESGTIENEPETTNEEKCETVNESVDDNCNDKEATQEPHEDKSKKKRKRNRK